MTHPFPVKVVALQAGVSMATVDRVIKQRGGVHANTVRRVMQALDELARQSTQVGLSGKKFMLDVLMVAPRRFTDAVRAALDASVRLLEELGHHVEEVSPDLGVPWDAFVQANASIWCANLVPWMDGVAQESGRAVSPDTLEAATLACYRYGQTVSAVDFVAALDVRNTVTRQAGALFGRYDVLLTPTLPDLPWPLGRYGESEAALDGPGWTARLFEHSPYTPLANVAGLPAMSVPLAMSADGLPIGMQFMAAYGNDGTLLRLAGQLERAAPWGQRRPAVWAGNTEN